MKLDLSDSAELQKVVAAAIVQTVDANKRDALVATAIEHLIAPPKDRGYGAPPSPLECAFRDAVTAFARRESVALLEGDEALKGTIRSLLAEAAERAFVTNRDATVANMAEALVRGMTRE